MTTDDAAEGYRPWVLDLGLDEDRARFEQLRSLERKGAVRLIDRVAAQREEIQELVMREDRWPRAAPSTRWIFFPWRSVAVHLLAQPHFNLLRLDRNRNKLTPEEQERCQALTVTVVGLSVGHVIAHCLAMEGLCGRLRLADFDAIELSNLNRVPASVLDLGVNKAVVVARRIAEIDPYLPVEVEPRGVTTDTVALLLDSADLIVEECDSLDVKLRIRQHARALGIPVLMETSDRGLLDVERFDLEPDRPILHGLLDVSADLLSGLSTEDKVPHVLRILDASQLSARMAASLVEVDRTVSTWPQLGGDVTLGAATVAAALRRLGRGQPLLSGRVRIDLEDHLGALSQPPVPRPIGAGPAPNVAVPARAALARRLAAAGNLAPSGGNCQPWRFRWVDGGMELRVDDRRITNRLDVGRRGAYVAIGAAAENMRATAALVGICTAVRLARTAGGEVIATVARATNDRELEGLAALASSVEQRCTNRRKASGGPLRAEHLAALEASVGIDASCHWLRLPAEVHSYALIAGEGDRVRYLTPTLHADLVEELRFPQPGDQPPEDGIDIATLELAADDLAKLEIIRRTEVMAELRAWGLGRALTDGAVDVIDTSSAVCAITVEGHELADFVCGGQALERFWLTATRLGVAVQPVSPPWVYAREEPDLGGIFAPEFVDEIWRWDGELASLLSLSTRSLILALRLGYAPPPTARSGRRQPPLELGADSRPGGC
jgi:molybdopterin/thiamine biosynthesis adenylyltransferase/nitroreductase